MQIDLSKDAEQIEVTVKQLTSEFERLKVPLHIGGIACAIILARIKKMHGMDFIIVEETPNQKPKLTLVKNEPEVSPTK